MQIELPERREPPKPAEDPNEYARRLRANSELIEDAVDPQHVIPVLLQNGVLSELEERLLAEVKGQHALTWSVLWGVLMQRGASAYSAFMGALLRHGYDALFHTVQETKVRVWVGVTDYTPYRRPRSGFGWVSLVRRPRSGFEWVSLVRRPRSGFGWVH